MTSKLDKSHGDQQRSRAYGVEFGISMAAYVVATLVVSRWGGLDGDSSARYWWALVPVLPSIGMVIALVRHLRRCDEYQRHLLLLGLSAGFGTAMLASITLGWLGVAGLVVPMGHWIVFGAGMTVWGLTSGLAGRW